MNAMWRSRMFWRLSFTCGLVLLAAIGLLGWVVLQRVQQHALRQIADSLHSKAVLVREVVRGWPNTVTDPDARVRALGREIGARITLIAAGGKVLADSHENHRVMENHGSRPEVRIAGNEGFGTATRFSDTIRQPMMYAALRTDGVAGPRFVRVALPLGVVEEQLAELRRIVWTAAAATALAALLLAFGLARRITRPLQELTAGAERLAAGDYGHRVYVPGPDEVGVLARTFNHMSVRLAGQFAQLEEDRQQLRAILSGMIEGVIALDARQHILFTNDRAAQLLQLPSPSVVGRKLWEVVRQPKLLEVVRRALEGSEPTQEEMSWHAAPARCLTVHAARLAGPSPRGVIIVLHDTTKLRRLEQVRQEFVANVSHELKTPLSVIKACVETLLDGAVDDAQHRGPFLERIADQAERLHNLILDLLSLARIESEAEAFQFQRVPLEPLVVACLERHRARAEGKKQHLEAACAGRPVAWSGNEDASPGRGLADSAPATPEVAAWADEEAMSQILDNLVDNAVKYTPEGGRIAVRWKQEDGRVCLEVQDTGIGIGEADLPRIFERFYRVDRARSRELGGTGLGLSIVKHLVQAMHGTVQATSQPGRGTCFHVSLPCPPTP